MISENLAEDPVIPGHEAVMSVVKVEEKRIHSTKDIYNASY